MAFSHLHIRSEVGLFGENTSTNLLIQKGYTILERNWKVGHLELDIIAENKTHIVFVEVKTRSQIFGRLPEEYVDHEKQRNMINAANTYIHLHHIDKIPRFDIVGIVVNPLNHEIININHIENAFQPMLRTVNRGSFRGFSRWKAKKRR